MPSPTKPPALHERAFPAHPRPDRYFAAAATEAARRRVLQCVRRGDGPAMLLGAPGVGKSMLLEVLAEDLAGAMRVVRLASGQLCTRRALLQAILHALDAPYRNRDEGELRLSLADLLEETPEPVALLVDEAQTLPTRLLEELRSLTNVVANGAPALRLVLAGTHALDETFTAPELEAFSQRLAARCYLEPLRRDEIAQYVRAHVAAAGGEPDAVIEGGAYDAIAQASDGLPRLINQVADRALLLSADRGSAKLSGEAVSEAWSDLHQLAAPWQSPSSATLAAAATPAVEQPTEIEFGSLDDEDHDALQAEAEAVTALASDIGVDHGVWDAGDKLRELATALDEPATPESEDELVAYAFPGVGEAEEPDAKDDSSADVADEESVVEPPVEPPAPVSVDPFAESFDEEEVVLDPHADLERVIPAAPAVALSGHDEVARAFGELPAPMAELAESAVAVSTKFVAEAEEQATLDAADDILIVEHEEEAVVSGGATRQEYVDLFANLRQG